jgi:hypothetical protein
LPEDGYGRCYFNLFRERVHDTRATSYEKRDALLWFWRISLVRYRLARIETKVGDQVISDEVP